jgi:hypothetical protein
MEKTKPSTEAITRPRPSPKITSNITYSVEPPSIENSRLDQRPWVTFGDFKLNKEPVAGEEISIAWELRNSGKTPALESSIYTVVRIAAEAIVKAVEKMGLSLNPTFVTKEVSRSVSIIAPGNSNTVTGITNPVDFGRNNREHLITLYRAKQARLYVHILVRYKDIAATPHWTTACAYHIFGEGLSDFINCPQGNVIDKNRKESGPIGPAP